MCPMALVPPPKHPVSPPMPPCPHCVTAVLKLHTVMHQKWFLKHKMCGNQQDKMRSMFDCELYLLRTKF